MVGFGNGLVQSLGSISLDITIDGISATVLCKVVQNHLLERPILIGQSYSEQPHIVVYKDTTKLQFFNLGSIVPDAYTNDNAENLVRISIAKHCEIHGPASIRASTEPEFTGNILVKTKLVSRPFEQYVVTGGIYTVREGKVFIAVTPCSTPKLLQRGSIFSRAERVELVNRLVSCPVSEVKLTEIDRGNI
jgi:hypothetical protein